MVRQTAEHPVWTMLRWVLHHKHASTKIHPFMQTCMQLGGKPSDHVQHVWHAIAQISDAPSSAALPCMVPMFTATVFDHGSVSCPMSLHVPFIASAWASLVNPQEQVSY